MLNRHTVQGELFRTEGDKLRCLACGHTCLLGVGRRGICKVRYNRTGELRVPSGYVAGVACDPVEKKPFFHVYPGSDTLTFGMAGCNLHCGYCQNWSTSQVLRDAEAWASIKPATAEQLVVAAKRNQARLVVSSYNEPLITAEWAATVFRVARENGLLCAIVSNGNGSPEVIDYLAPWLDAVKIDLKSFQEGHYRELGATLDRVKQTLRRFHEKGIWLEVVTLLVPGFNDSADEVRAMARFLAGISPTIPWHLTAFHPDYRMTRVNATRATDLVRACQIAASEGLHFVYAGNLPGQTGPWEDTRCPNCRETLIQRYGYLVRQYRLQPGGKCSVCQTQLPGLWPNRFDGQPISLGLGDSQRRFPRHVNLQS